MSTTERMQRMERLLEVTRNLSASLDFEPLLHSMISLVCELTSSETASILRHDPASDTLSFLAMPFYHRDAMRTARVPVDGSAAGLAFSQQRPVQMSDAPTDSRHFKEVDRLTGFTTRSLLAVPLIFRGEPIGVIEAVNKIGDAHYTEEDVTVLETIGAQAALAIHAHELQKQVDVLSVEMSELDKLKTDFIAITSHELRTPLGLILGHATFLRELSGDQFHEQLDTIIRSATKLKDIVENLSNVDNFESGAARVRQRMVSMVRLVQDTVAAFQLDARNKGVMLRADVGVTRMTTGSLQSLTVEADPGKIAIALGNLIKNSIMFTDKGGHIFVTAEAVPGFVKVSVVDDGIGIPMKDLPRIFERFYQVESHLTRRHGGMGLGLSVAKAMIEMHGGRIWAESVEGKGSNFSFLLPINSAQATAAQKVFVK